MVSFRIPRERDGEAEYSAISRLGECYMKLPLGCAGCFSDNGDSGSLRMRYGLVREIKLLLLTIYNIKSAFK